MHGSHPSIEHGTQQNPHLKKLDVDFLYHLGLDTSIDLKEIFGDVKYVCMGGSPDRAEYFAEKVGMSLGVLTRHDAVLPIGKTERYSLYKVGPVLSISHGIGMPSASVVWHEVTKLLRYAGATDFKYIRIGTSGGLGVKPGDVVVSTNVVDGRLRPVFEQDINGERVEYSTELDQQLIQALLGMAGDGVAAVAGTTMSTNDFYEGQSRMDGALDPGYTDDEKMAFLQRAYDQGVRNIEMEAALIAALGLRAGIPTAVVCTTLLDRLEGDQVTSTPWELAQFSDNAQRLVIRLIVAELAKLRSWAYLRRSGR